MIKKTSGKNEWCVFSEAGKNLGCYDSKEKAEKRLAQIEMFKHQEAIGQGQGMGNPKQGDGGVGYCKCTECGAVIEHDKGTPCLESSCPKCGGKMVGATKENVSEMNKTFIEKLIKEQINIDGGIEKVLRAYIVDQYGISKQEATGIVKAGFDKESVKKAMDEIGLAEKLQVDYIGIISMWRGDMDMATSSNALEFLMKESVFEMEITESKNNGSVYEVVIIEEGKSYNKTVYTPQSLKDMVKIINEASKSGAPIPCNAFKFSDTLNHLSDSAKSFSKGFVENIVGWFKNAKVVGKKLMAELHISDGAKNIKEMLKTAFAKGIKKPFGLSIDGEGDVQEGNDGIENVLNVLGIKLLNSVDCVTHPSAGGKFVKIIESFHLKEQKMNKLLIEMIGKIYGSLIEGIDLTAVDFDKAKSVLAEAGKKDERFKFELTEANMSDAIKKISDIAVAIKEETLKVVKPVEPVVPVVDPKKADAKVTEGMSEAEVLLQNLREATEKAQLDSCAMTLSKVLDESKLSENFKNLIREEFKERIFTENDLRKKVTEMETAVSNDKEVNETSQITVIANERDKKLDDIQASMDRLCGCVDENGRLVEGTDRWRGIREAYESITGDVGVTTIIRSGRSRLTEGIKTSDFPYLLANSQTKRMMREYNIGDAMYRKIASITSVPDFKTQDRIALGELANLSTVAEDAAYTEFADPSEEKATYTATKRGNYIGISRESILNDDLRGFNKVVTMIGKASLRTLNTFTFNLLLSYTSAINDTVIYDSTVLYTSAHGNITSDALTYSSLDGGLTSMWNHKDMDGKLELGIEPKYLIVPRALKTQAQRIIQSPDIPGTTYKTFNDINPVMGAVEILVSPFLQGDADNWYLLADPNIWDGIELGFVQGKESPTLITSRAETDAEMFTNDRIRYKVRHEYGGAVKDYRPFFAGLV